METATMEMETIDTATTDTDPLALPHWHKMVGFL